MLRFAALLLAACAVDGKGSASGGRSVGQRASWNSRAYAVPFLSRAGAGYDRTWTDNSGNSYSPSYGGWEDTGGWRGNGKCGTKNQCDCPRPNDRRTEVWVRVQMYSTIALNAYSPEPGRTDVTTVEVDLYKEIASRAACNPPTEVLLTRTCGETDMKYVTGGMADDQLNSQNCVTWGDESSRHLPHFQARLRRLQQNAEIPVFHFVVGATSRSHGNSLEEYIRDAAAPGSKFATTYGIPAAGVLSVDTDDDGNSDDGDGGGGGGGFGIMEMTILLSLMPVFIVCGVIGYICYTQKVNREKEEEDASQRYQEAVPARSPTPQDTSPYGNDYPHPVMRVSPRWHGDMEENPVLAEFPAAHRTSWQTSSPGDLSPGQRVSLQSVPVAKPCVDML